MLGIDPETLFAAVTFFILGMIVTVGYAWGLWDEARR